MSIKRNIFDFLYNMYNSHSGHKTEKKKQCDKMRKNIANSIILSRQQKLQIDEFYKKNYGKKISYKWHKIYTAISGKFDYRFFPELLYTPDFQRLSNSNKYYYALSDKNIQNKVFGSNLYFRVPTHIFSCSNGIIIDRNNNIISEEKMLNELTLLDSFFVKPTTNSDSGKNCSLLHGSFKDLPLISSTIRKLGKDYAVQEKITNQDDIAALNPRSLNTFRIITYILNGVIYASPIVLRIGRNGSTCDNAHAGGIFVAVSNEGMIISNAKTEFGENLESHPNTNIKFVGYKIKNVDKVINAAKMAASMIPHIGVVDWDFTLDETGTPVLIESNVFGGSIWLVQMSHGVGVFGDQTSEILQLVKNNKPVF